MKSVFKIILIVLAISGNFTQVRAISSSDLKAINLGVTIYYGGDVCSAIAGSTQSGVSELEGHKLPAARGGAGIEESIDEEGRVPSTGGRVAFYEYASLGQEYRDYYITMRWRYRIWAWSGRSQAGPEDASWYKQDEPRKVLVTNPTTGKSIIAAVLEAGPAPWTGTAGGSASKDDPPEYWRGYIDGTPAAYDGRVAGFPPAAVEALGMQQWEHGGPGSSHPRGSGHELIYSWAPDQNAEPGPTNISATSATGAAACAIGGGLGVSAEGFVFPLVSTKSSVSGKGWCYESQDSCHHNYNAADIFEEPGITVVAAKPGTVVRAVNQNGGVGSRVVIKGDDGFVYYYAHMTNGSVSLSEGDAVAAGDVLGTVGESEQAKGTPPHLHFDILPPEYSQRPSCSGGACRAYPFINPQPLLIPAFEALPD